GDRVLRASKTRTCSEVAPPPGPSSWTASAPGSGASSAISAALVTQTASKSRINRWQPADAADVTGPGMAPSGLPSAAAWPAVLSEPDLHPASITTVAWLAAAMSLFRCKNLHLVGCDPGGSSETTAPDSTIRVSRAS